MTRTCEGHVPSARPGLDRVHWALGPARAWRNALEGVVVRELIRWALVLCGVGRWHRMTWPVLRGKPSAWPEEASPTGCSRHPAFQESGRSLHGHLARR